MSEKKVAVYGASDDLIEVEGDISEEFGVSDCDTPNYLAFSDGTVLLVEYTDAGFWRINRLQSGSAKYEKHEGTDESTDYSDRVTLTGVEWVVCGKDYAGKK